MPPENNFTLPMLEWCEIPAGKVMIDADAGLPDPPPCQDVHAGIGVHGGEGADVAGIAGEVEPGAHADFEDAAGGAGEQIAP